MTAHKSCDHLARTEPAYCDACGGRVCGARNKNCCLPKGCGHRFIRDEYGLTHCPDCGRIRFCSQERIYKVTGRCKTHGGPSLSGPANPNWLHGKYASNLISKGRAREADEAFAQVTQAEILDSFHSMMNVQLRILELHRYGPTTDRLLAIKKTLKVYEATLGMPTNTQTQRSLASLHQEAALDELRSA